MHWSTRGQQRDTAVAVFRVAYGVRRLSFGRQAHPKLVKPCRQYDMFVLVRTPWNGTHTYLCLIEISPSGRVNTSLPATQSL